MKIAVVALALAWALASQADQSYRHGRVIKITSEVRSEGSVTPPQGEDGKSQRHLVIRNHGEVFYISIRSGDDVYVAEVMSGAPGFDPQTLSANRDVQFRTDGKVIDIKPSKGKEFSARLLPELHKHSPPVQNPKPARIK